MDYLLEILWLSLVESIHGDIIENDGSVEWLNRYMDSSFLPGFLLKGSINGFVKLGEDLVCFVGGEIQALLFV